MSHVAVHKILWAGFPSPINTSGSAVLDQKIGSSLLLQKKQVIFIIFKFSFI